jgi:hypothetical protein
MQSKIFHNTKYLEENLTTNNMPSSTYLNRKKIVDVNKLLNRVKINRQNEKKKKIIFFSSGIILLSLVGTFLAIVK